MTSDPAMLVREADAAAARGDVSAARCLLEAASAGTTDDPDVPLKLAAMCRAAGDPRAALAATDAALAIEPLHFVALMLRANLLERAGDAGASEAYGRALAQRPNGALPPQLGAMARHAETIVAAHRAREDARLVRAIAPLAAALSHDEIARVARFRSNALRATRPYHSEPADYHYPGLIEREFHDRADMPWVGRLEAATDLIAAEFEAVMMAERAELVPYVQYPATQPLRQWKALNNSPDWLAIHLIRNGATIDANARHCPATMALLAALPMPGIPGMSPNAMFSLLAPGARIPPHTGIANTRLVCHLPLIVPDGCWFRVGAERRTWRRGEAWMFDDTIEHEAANESGALRVILILDLWHPGLSMAERDAVATMIAAHGRTGDASL